MKIYDCFNFFNELDILEIRLNTLKDCVDYFVIVESNITHSGEDKPFYFEENKDRFSEFLDKIISYKVYDTPNDFSNLNESDFEGEDLSKIYNYIISQTNRFDRNTQLDYGRDFFQKESVRRPLLACEDDDVIIISDADEVPNPEILKNLKNLDLKDNIYSLSQPMYSYHVNTMSDPNWYGSKLGLYKNIKNLSFNEIRGDQSLSIKIPNGGWHFSFMGGEKKIIEKIEAYSHQEFNNDHIKCNVKNNIENDQDIFFRGQLTQVPIDETYPKYLLENLDKYSEMIKK